MARRNGLGVGILGSGDDGRANWVELILLSRYHREGAGIVTSSLDLDVSGCVRVTVAHGEAGGDARLGSRPCYGTSGYCPGG